MRHLWSLLAGVVIAPLTWVLVAAGQHGSSHVVSEWVKNDSYAWANLLGPAVYLAAAGLLLGLIATLRFSPLGPMVGGLLLVGPYAGMFAAPFVVRETIPDNWEFRNVDLPLRLPLENGTLLLLGGLLLMATFSIQRWRRWPNPDAPVDKRGLGDWPPESGQDSLSPTTTEPALPLPRRETDSPWATSPSMAGRNSI